MLDGYIRGNKEYFRARIAASGIPAELQGKALDSLTAFFNLYVDLIDAGIDWFRETVDYAKQRNLAIWSSLRMNDTHGSGDPDGAFDSGPLYRNSKYRFAGRGLPIGGASPVNFIGLNYSFPEVRKYMLSFIEEQVEYGVEGVELDWLRDPLCMPAPASERDAALMTDFMQEARLITQRNSVAHLGLRIPANLGYLQDIGLDVRRWANEGLIDFISFGSYWQCAWDAPLDDLRREVGDKVAIYGVIEGAANLMRCRAPALERFGGGTLDEAKVQQLGDKIAGAADLVSEQESFRYAAACPEILRGNAAGKLALGATGIETFNFYVTDQVHIPGVRSHYEALIGLDDLEVLRGKSKQYCFSTFPESGFYGWEMVEQLPFYLSARARRELRLAMCAEAQGM